MNIPKNLKYTSSHEWVRIEGNTVFIGITDYAQEHLGEIVFVELPEVNDEVTKGAPLAVVESVKAAADVYAPLSGTVSEVNEALLDNPELVNQDPYENWIVTLEISNPAEIEDLLDPAEYEKVCEQEE
ncbi:MAG TPA: glycine cleavage system protein GcvH [Peptococcaceae bacterium]|nr:glycine cleavage system protein GcvH [Peptococcaceae bacterium]